MSQVNAAICSVLVKVEGYLDGTTNPDKPIDEVARDLRGPIEFRGFTVNEMRIIRHCLARAILASERATRPPEPPPTKEQRPALGQLVNGWQ